MAGTCRSRHCRLSVPGKQPGSPGSHLAWSEYPDDKVPHFPAGACECGADLAGAGDLGVAASHQQVEIPLVSAQVIQHDLHAVRCDCGRVHQAAAPASGMRSAATYPPPASMASTSFPPCATPSPAIPGCHPSLIPRSTPPAGHTGSLSLTQAPITAECLHAIRHTAKFYIVPTGRCRDAYPRPAKPWLGRHSTGGDTHGRNESTCCASGSYPDHYSCLGGRQGSGYTARNGLASFHTAGNWRYSRRPCCCRHANSCHCQI